MRFFIFRHADIHGSQLMYPTNVSGPAKTRKANSKNWDPSISWESMPKSSAVSTFSGVFLKSWILLNLRNTILLNRFCSGFLEPRFYPVNQLDFFTSFEHPLWFTFQVKRSLIFFLAPAWFWTILVLVQNAPRGSKLGAWTWEEPVPCWWILKGYADKDWTCCRDTRFSFMCKFTAWTSLLPFPSARGSALARSSTAASLQELQTVLLAWVCLQCSNAMMDVFKSPQTPKACLFNTLWWGCTSGRGQRDLADRSSSSAAGGSLQLTSNFAALEVKQALCFLTPTLFFLFLYPPQVLLHLQAMWSYCEVLHWCIYTS